MSLNVSLKYGPVLLIKDDNCFKKTKKITTCPTKSCHNHMQSLNVKFCPECGSDVKTNEKIVTEQLNVSSFLDMVHEMAIELDYITTENIEGVENHIFYDQAATYKSTPDFLSTSKGFVIKAEEIDAERESLGVSVFSEHTSGNLLKWLEEMDFNFTFETMMFETPYL